MWLPAGRPEMGRSKNRTVARVSWVKAVQAIVNFLGIAAPIQMDHYPDGDVRFTIEFETPEAPPMIDAKYDVFALEDPPLTHGWRVVAIMPPKRCPECKWL